MAKILIADDERDIRDLIAFTIRFAGHDVFSATNGEEVVEMAPQVMPDLFLLDVRMPRITGYEACKILKANPAVKHIPVVFLSAKGQESEIQQGLEAGAEEYLLKPFAPDTLTSHITTVLRNKNLGIYDEDDKDDGNDEADDVKYLVHLLRGQRKKTREALKKLLEKEYELSDVSFKLRILKSRLSSGEFGSVAQEIYESEAPARIETAIQYPLAEISRITDGIVHDMRNGMGIIRNTIGFMSDDLAGTPHENDILKISQSLDFCELVLRNLSALGGRDVLQPEWVDLEELIGNVCFMLEKRLVDVDVDIRIEPGASTKIYADQGHMKQIFMNLIKNAGEAMPNGGRLTCNFRRDHDVIRVEISDTGTGITQENQERLFRQLFTTKERGYGLGLFIVSTIVERYSGQISVHSRLGVGTTFTLKLPVKGMLL